MQALKSDRLHIGVFGKTNVGKSSVLNRITGQEISIVSDIAGTTTDVVEKSMELLPVGPVQPGLTIKPSWQPGVLKKP